MTEALDPTLATRSYLEDKKNYQKYYIMKYCFRNVIGGTLGRTRTGRIKNKIQRNGLKMG